MPGTTELLWIIPMCCHGGHAALLSFYLAALPEKQHWHEVVSQLVIPQPWVFGRQTSRENTLLLQSARAPISDLPAGRGTALALDLSLYSLDSCFLHCSLLLLKIPLFFWAQLKVYGPLGYLAKGSEQHPHVLICCSKFILVQVSISPFFFPFSFPPHPLSYPPPLPFYYSPFFLFKSTFIT